MEKIDGRWMHDGKEYDVVEGDCGNCDFNNQPFCLLKFSKTCSVKLGGDKYFKLKENQNMIRPFKCAFSSMEQSITIRQALYNKGMIKNVITVANSLFRFNHAGTDSTTNLEAFGMWPEPLMTFDQAMEMILAAPVLKKEPVFDIKLRDEVLCRDSSDYVWEIKHFARPKTPIGFQTFDTFFYQMLPFKGNEHLHGTTDTPDGWWEVKDNKPVWVTK